MPAFTKIRGASPAIDRAQDRVAVAFRRIEDAGVVAERLEPTQNTNRISAAMVIERFVIPAGATATLTYPFPNGREIVDVWLKKTNAAGGGAGTIRVQTSGANAITDAMSINVADQTIVRAAIGNDVMHRIADGRIGFLRTRGASTDESCIAYIVTMAVP